MYNPHQKEQDDLGTFFKSQGAKRFYGPLTLCLDFWIKVGKASDNYNVVGIKDLSNMVKLVEDAGNEILWFDDRQIVELRANKHYAGEGQEERTEIVVIALDSVPVGKIAGFWEH